jgi:hypothetical protein
MLIPRILMRIMATAVVGFAAFSTPPTAEAFDWCEVCWPSTTCGLGQLQWETYCSSVSCGGGAACWNFPGEACPPGYVYVECGHES